MSVAPLPSGRARRVNGRLIAAAPPRPRGLVSQRRIDRRQTTVTWTKRLLPVAALALLTAVVMWPQLQQLREAGRTAYNRMVGAAGGELIDAHYRGVDERGQPYTLTAASAQQVSPERVNLVQPKGDSSMRNGSWVMVSADDGVYIQHTGQLDLSGHVVLYRDDGTTLHTSSAAIDLKQGAAAGSADVSAEGPFGTLDARGFSLVDKGGMIQFTGPARLVMNSRSK